jgi:hypothetical protein
LRPKNPEKKVGTCYRLFGDIFKSALVTGKTPQ